MKIMFCLVLVFVIVTGCNSGNYRKVTDPELKKEVLLVSKNWLKLIDDKNYNQSWDEATEDFKANMSKSKWESMVGRLRAKLGDVEEREVISMIYTTSLPNAPKGEYVVIKFQTKFTNINVATETITPSKDNSGKWCISGYYINK